MGRTVDIALAVDICTNVWYSGARTGYPISKEGRHEREIGDPRRPAGQDDSQHPHVPRRAGDRRGREKEVLEVLERKYLFRYYGPQEYPSKVRELEVKFADKVGSKHALAVNSCTSALITALVAVGVGPGDEVIVTGYTFFASCAAIVGAKAIPVVARWTRR